MTYEEYWYGDPLMVGAFYKALKIREEQKDTDAWLSGMYVLQALQATVGNMFLPKGKQPFTYPDKPMLYKREEAEKEKREKTLKEQEQEIAFAKLYMTALMEAGKNWGKK